ncbi:PMS1 1 [Lecanosticta acicola]|uniref:PMS1 1 n=1 Tax=Lecanosticta acicola TaxID=111012 RepID=A0AAI8Z1L3_9PEZI|nr:PMS1 1 [Lecanosticta acicola]
MGIQALPDTTIRTLGATQALTDASTLIKELIDNSLDANATSISVEVHSNTLDLIQVRDNGHGIVPEDRPLVARRYCTSKLTHDDELENIGGTSLGFRGEALASAAELSGSLTISTRVEGEMIAAALKIDRKGEVISQDRASLPIGTTVRVTDFIKANPVRRQNALKNTDKCIKTIKRVLQAYAFARPHVRLSLRIAKAKKPINDWVYAPKPGGNAEEAAFKIVGAACASQCVWSLIEEHGFTLQAFLPRPEADVSKISNTGYFISVDARPVSATASSFKQMIKIFREAMKDTNAKFEGIRDPFLYLEIDCPVGSYDVNLEPSKNDVLFEDNALVIGAVRKLFDAVYAKPVVAAHKPPDVEESNCNDDNVEADGNPKIPEPQIAMPVQLEEHGDGRVNEAASQMPGERIAEEEAAESGRDAATVRNFRSNMYGCDEEDLELLDDALPIDRTEADIEELRQARHDVGVSNPWILAKLNSSVRRTVQAESLADDPPVSLPVELLSSPTKRTQRPQRMETAFLPTPRPSSPSPPADDSLPPDHVVSIRSDRNGRLRGPPALPLLQPHTPVPSSDAPMAEHDVTDLPGRRTQPMYNYRLTPDATAGSSAMPPRAMIGKSGLPCADTRPKPRGRVNKPFKPPIKDQPDKEKVWFDHLEQVDKPRGAPKKQYNQSSDGLVSQGDVDAARSLSPPQRNRDIREFVGSNDHNCTSAMIESRNHDNRSSRNQVAEQENNLEDMDERKLRPRRVLGGRDFIPASDLAVLEEYGRSPEKQRTRAPKRRKTSERRPLSDMNANTPLAQQDNPVSIDEPGASDPGNRKRGISRRQSSHKTGRTKSSRLPLERVPAGQGMHNVVYSMPISPRDVSKLAGKIDEEASLFSYNQPSVNIQPAFDSDQLDLQDLTNNLYKLLLKASPGSDTEDDPELPDRLFTQLRAALALRRNAPEEDIDRADEIMS